MTKHKIEASELEQRFDDGEDFIDIVGSDSIMVTRPNLKQKRINVDMPQWMVDRLDHEAKRIGTSRQAVIKHWLSDRLGQS